MDIKGFSKLLVSYTELVIYVQIFEVCKGMVTVTDTICLKLDRMEGTIVNWVYFENTKYLKVVGIKFGKQKVIFFSHSLLSTVDDCSRNRNSVS